MRRSGISRSAICDEINNGHFAKIDAKCPFLFDISTVNCYTVYITIFAPGDAMSILRRFRIERMKDRRDFPVVAPEMLLIFRVRNEARGA